MFHQSSSCVPSEIVLVLLRAWSFVLRALLVSFLLSLSFYLFTHIHLLTCFICTLIVLYLAKKKRCIHHIALAYTCMHVTHIAFVVTVISPSVVFSVFCWLVLFGFVVTQSHLTSSFFYIYPFATQSIAARS